METKTILSDNFLNKYDDFPKHMSEIGTFVFLRTYSRFLPDKNRRETYKEVVRRACEYNVELLIKHYTQLKYTIDLKELEDEAELLFDNMFNLKQFLSGRTMWIGGTKSSYTSPSSNFNCSYLSITKWDDMCDLFYMLMVGTGTGFGCSKKYTDQLPPIKTTIKLIHSEYKPVDKKERLEKTELRLLPNNYAKIYIGDSKEGWVESLRVFFNILTNEEYKNIHTVKISYNSIRGSGERLNTFGGQASGYEPLKELFIGIENVLKNKIDEDLEEIKINRYGYGKVRPIHILDIANLIGSIVVVGGVRRTSEIALFDQNDYEIMFAKFGINGVWSEEHLKQYNIIEQNIKDSGIVPPKCLKYVQKIGNMRPNINHRRMSNNSIIFDKKPSKEFLDLVFNIMRLDGEPGFCNYEEMCRRRPNVKGLNPCGEILLDTYGLCNLTTVNWCEFVKENKDGKKYIDEDELVKTQRLSTRCGIRMTLVDLELPHWDFVQKRDRLIGTSLTGVKDAIDRVGYSFDDEKRIIKKLKDASDDESINYSKKLRINVPLLTTTVKPEGTLSQVCGSVSSGLHLSHSEYFIRRIRINACDPLAKTVMELGWSINPEVGTKGDTYEEKMKNARTLVIDFPVYSGSKKTKSDSSVKEQLDTYFSYQKLYTSHNSSNTITVKPDEWKELEQIIYENWDNFVGVSFMQLDGGTYELAPYQECDKKTYEELKNKMKTFDMNILNKFETLSNIKEIVDDSIEIPDTEYSNNSTECVNGVCPRR